MLYFSNKHITLIVLLGLTWIGARAQDLLRPSAFQEALENTNNGILIDIRTPEEFAFGHLKNAINIDFKSPDFNQKIKALNRDATIFLYCRSGSTTITGSEQMRTLGFTHIHLLSGGYIAWEKKHLPIEDSTYQDNKEIFTKEDLQTILDKHERVLVDFNAKWCGPCLLLAPKIKKIEKEFAGKIFLQSVNVDKASRLTEDMNVRSIPLLILFENGKPIRALEGNQSLKNIRHFIQQQ